MEIEYIQSQRGQKLLIFEGYIYTKHSDKVTSMRWRCQLRSCKGLIVVDLEDKILSFLEHDHPANMAKIEVLKVKNNIKKNRAYKRKDKRHSYKRNFKSG